MMSRIVTTGIVVWILTGCAVPEQTTNGDVPPDTTSSVNPVVVDTIRERTVIERFVKQPDRTTYKSLTDLKPEVMMLYETFTQAPLDHEWIWRMRLRLAQVYEYEKGKGRDHRDRAAQIQAIREQFNKDLEQRQESGPWSATQVAGKSKAIEAVFDTAIKAQWDASD